MSNGKVVLGLLAGVATGALLGILFAPQKGSKTRKNVLNKKDDYSDLMTKKFEEFMNSVNAKYENVKEDISHLTDKKTEKAAKA